MWYRMQFRYISKIKKALRSKPGVCLQKINDMISVCGDFNKATKKKRPFGAFFSRYLLFLRKFTYAYNGSVPRQGYHDVCPIYRPQLFSPLMGVEQYLRRPFAQSLFRQCPSIVQPHLSAPIVLYQVSRSVYDLQLIPF